MTEQDRGPADAGGAGRRRGPGTRSAGRRGGRRDTRLARRRRGNGDSQRVARAAARSARPRRRRKCSGWSRYTRATSSATTDAASSAGRTRCRRCPGGFGVTGKPFCRGWSDGQLVDQRLSDRRFGPRATPNEIFRVSLKSGVRACTVTSLGLPRAARVGLFRRPDSESPDLRNGSQAGSVTDRGSLFYNLKRGGGGLPNTQSPTAPPASWPPVSHGLSERIASPVADSRLNGTAGGPPCPSIENPRPRPSLCYAPIAS